jgi:hypothetical protein
MAHYDPVMRSASVSPPMAPLPPPVSTSPSLGPQPAAGVFRPPPMDMANANATTNGIARSSSRYKSELCRNFQASGHCAYSGCVFAHGVEELRASWTSGAVAANGTTATSTQAVLIEKLVEQLNVSIQSELENLRLSQEANRRLEGTLRREQSGRREDTAAIDAWELHIDALRTALAEHGVANA